MPTPMRSSGAVRGGMKVLQEARDTALGRSRAGGVGSWRRECPPGSFGLGILVISGRGRSMYQHLAPKAGGSNLIAEVKPQGTQRTPHDPTVATVAQKPAQMNIQGDASCAKKAWERRK